VTGAAILNAVVAQAVALLLERIGNAPVFLSANLTGEDFPMSISDESLAWPNPGRAAYCMRRYIFPKEEGAQVLYGM
jgi:uncharacterized phosphosugar-binding protein